jgi:hypothetical protein
MFVVAWSYRKGHSTQRPGKIYILVLGFEDVHSVLYYLPKLDDSFISFNMINGFIS